MDRVSTAASSLIAVFGRDRCLQFSDRVARQELLFGQCDSEPPSMATIPTAKATESSPTSSTNLASGVTRVRSMLRSSRRMLSSVVLTVDGDEVMAKEATPGVLGKASLVLSGYRHIAPGRPIEQCAVTSWGVHYPPSQTRADRVGDHRDLWLPGPGLVAVDQVSIDLGHLSKSGLRVAVAIVCLVLRLRVPQLRSV